MSNATKIHLRVNDKDRSYGKDPRLYSNSSRPLGPYTVKNGSTANPIPPEEIEDVFGPLCVGRDYKELKTIHEKADLYLRNLDVSIPDNGTGRELNLVFDKEGKVIWKKHESNNLDYLIYMVAKNHPKVASSQEEAAGDKKRYLWYLVDSEKERKVEASRIDILDEAAACYLELKSNSKNESKVHMIAINMGINLTDKVTTDSRLTALRSLISDNTEQAQRFLDIYNDKDLKLKSDILMVVTDGKSDKLSVQSDGGFYYEERRIGADLKEAVSFFKDPANSSHKLSLQKLVSEIDKAK